MKKVVEKPAYIVDIETRYKSKANPHEMKNITSLTEDSADDALENFRQSHLERMNELSAVAPDQLDTSKPKFVLNSGADDIGGLFLAVRRMVEGGMAPAQEEEFFAQYEKYYNVQADIAERGKEAFLEYNLTNVCGNGRFLQRPSDRKVFGYVYRKGVIYTRKV